MNTPHGGKLVRRILTTEEKKEILAKAKTLPRIFISDEEVNEVKNIARGVFSPLAGFLDKANLDEVVTSGRLKSGLVFPIPIYLAVDKNELESIKPGKNVLLVDKNKKNIAVLSLSDIYTYDKKKFARNIFKTEESGHPGVSSLLSEGNIFLTGDISLIDNSRHPFGKLDLDPEEIRLLFAGKGWKNIAGFQTRNPIHRGHEYLQRCVLEFVDGLFINPVIGLKKKNDFKDEVIIKSYEKIIGDYYPQDRIVFSILPYRMRYAGPREAVLHAIIRKNFGCTHFIVGRDHAGVGNYYGPYDAQNIFEKLGDLGIEIIKMKGAFYCRKCGCTATANSCRHENRERIEFSGTYIRSQIKKKRPIPAEMMRLEVVKIIESFQDPFV